MAKAPAFQFYPNDYIRDTRILSLEARGAWADLLGFMWFAEERGTLSGSYEQFARMLSCSIDETKRVFDELNITKIANVTNCNGIVTVINRRMVREQKERISTKLRVRRFRNAQCNDSGNGKETPPSSSSSSSSKKESIKKEKIEFTENRFINIPDALREKWEAIAPGISIADEIAKAEAWVISNPKLKKSNWSRFLTNWIVRAQDHVKKYPAGGNGNGTSAKPYSGQKYYRPGERELSQKASDYADAVTAEYVKRKAALRDAKKNAR